MICPLHIVFALTPSPSPRTGEGSFALTPNPSPTGGEGG